MSGAQSLGDRDCQSREPCTNPRSHTKTTSRYFRTFQQQPQVNQHAQKPSQQVHATSNRARQPTSDPMSSHPKNIVDDLLPYCTTRPPMSREQVYALMDVAGNLKELVLLAIRAQSDMDAMGVLESAVGSDAAVGIMEFWAAEWPVD